MKAILITLLFLVSNAFAHGDEDHGATTGDPAIPTATGSQLKVVSYPGSLEVLVKYPAPTLHEPVTGRIYFADYATNHPVNPPGIELSFPGNFGTKVTKQPSKVSDGVYSFEAVFTRDTNHTALLKYSYGDAEQLASLSPFYAGTSASRQLIGSGAVASTDSGDHFPSWVLIPISLGLAVLGYVFLKRRRKILVSKRQSATTITQSKTIS